MWRLRIGVRGSRPEPPCYRPGPIRGSDRPTRAPIRLMKKQLSCRGASYRTDS